LSRLEWLRKMLDIGAGSRVRAPPKLRRSSRVKRGRGHFRHRPFYDWRGRLSQAGRRRNCAIASLRSR
jgi:hypothetical protein